jgi:hypothetical protein
MLLQDVRPSSMIGIKRLARQIRNAENVPLNQALRRAAQAASFSNFEHARRALPDASPAASLGHQLFLTAYWTERKTFELGRETLEIRLSKPLIDLCTRSEMKLVRALCNMRLASPDHLVKDMVCPSQDFARGQICQTVRALRFMEATGLRPSDYKRAQTATQILDCDLPDQDHISEWYDPASGRFILIDEPYSGAVVSAERGEWAVRNNWRLHASAWAGMYLPYRCALFVASDASGASDFDALLQKIDAIPAPVTAESWEGVSAGDHTLFASPLAISLQDKRRAKAKGTIVPRSSKRTIPYIRSFIGQARKPNGTMTLAEHQLAGRMVRALLQSCHKPWAVNDRLDRLQNTLVDWLYADVPERQFGDLDPVDLYYHAIADNDPLVIKADSTRGVADILADLKELLTNAYPNCAPLRKMTRQVEISLEIIEKATVGRR